MFLCFKCHPFALLLFAGDFTQHNLCRYTFSQQGFGDFAFRFRDTVNVGPRTGSDSDVNFLVASGHGGTAYLYSPLIHQSYLSCSFSFYYYFASAEPTNNISSTAMKLYIKRTDLGSFVLLWESSVQYLNNASWRQVTVPVRRVRHPFRLSLYAYQSSSNPAKVHAIDDVRMRSCEPPTPSSSGSCSSSYLRCGNNVCVLRRYMCDFEVGKKCLEQFTYPNPLTSLRRMTAAMAMTSGTVPPTP